MLRSLKKFGVSVTQQKMCERCKVPPWFERCPTDAAPSELSRMMSHCCARLRAKSVGVVFDRGVSRVPATCSTTCRRCVSCVSAALSLLCCALLPPSATMCGPQTVRVTTCRRKGSGCSASWPRRGAPERYGKDKNGYEDERGVEDLATCTALARARCGPSPP